MTARINEAMVTAVVEDQRALLDAQVSSATTIPVLLFELTKPFRTSLLEPTKSWSLSRYPYRCRGYAHSSLSVSAD
jgi:hypothetical protein